MFFDRIRKASGMAGLAAAVTLAWPALPASASPHGQPTAVTITPTFAPTLAAAPAAEEERAGIVEVAQNRRRVNRRRAVRNRQVRRNRAVRNRQIRRNRAARANRVYRNGRYYYYRDGGWYDNSGAALAAGVIGLAAGAVAAGALANSTRDQVVVDAVPAPYSAEWYRRCDLKYRSFRASDGTFLGYDGVRRTCTLP